MQLAARNPLVVCGYLRNETEAGMLLLKAAVPGININCFGLLPNPQQLSRWQLIVDLFYPKECSINYGIEKENSSLKYPLVEDAVRVIFDSGTQLVKSDTKSVYRIIPVHPSGRLHLGMSWQG